MLQSRWSMTWLLQGCSLATILLGIPKKHRLQTTVWCGNMTDVEEGLEQVWFCDAWFAWCVVWLNCTVVFQAHPSKLAASFYRYQDYEATDSDDCRFGVMSMWRTDCGHVQKSFVDSAPICISLEWSKPFKAKTLQKRLINPSIGIWTFDPQPLGTSPAFCRVGAPFSLDRLWITGEWPLGEWTYSLALRKT